VLFDGALAAGREAAVERVLVLRLRVVDDFRVVEALVLAVSAIVKISPS
jgi:uncharacterized protein YqfA (UPF0365 family)